MHQRSETAHPSCRWRNYSIRPCQSAKRIWTLVCRCIGAKTTVTVKCLIKGNTTKWRSCIKKAITISECHDHLMLVAKFAMQIHSCTLLRSKWNANAFWPALNPPLYIPKWKTWSQTTNTKRPVYFMWTIQNNIIIESKYNRLQLIFETNCDMLDQQPQNTQMRVSISNQVQCWTNYCIIYETIWAIKITLCMSNA